MTPEAKGWYHYIAESTEELRADFKRMERQRLSPRDFGLRVKNHPLSLIVTAKNKMRAGTECTLEFSFDGELIQTTGFHKNSKINNENWLLANNFVTALQKQDGYQLLNNGHLFSDVKLEKMSGFIENYKSHASSYKTQDTRALVNYLNKIKSEFPTGFVLIRTLNITAGDPLLTLGENLHGRVITRDKGISPQDDYFTFDKRNITEQEDESVGLLDETIQNLKHERQKRVLYRKAKEKLPLLIIYPLYIKQLEITVIGYALSFPGDKSNPDKKLNTVSYMVNTTYLKKYYENDTEFEELEELEKHEEEESQIEQNK